MKITTFSLAFILFILNHNTPKHLKGKQVNPGIEIQTFDEWPGRNYWMFLLFLQESKRI